MNDNAKIEPDWEEFYNYGYWRAEQRKQLTIVSNVYFALSSAIVGFTIKYLVNPVNYSSLACERVLLLIGVIFNILSLILYVLLTNNKLKDYRQTAQMIKKGESAAHDIASSTSSYGNRIWDLFRLQKIFLFVGFVFCFLGYAILILK